MSTNSAPNSSASPKTSKHFFFSFASHIPPDEFKLQMGESLANFWEELYTPSDKKITLKTMAK